MSHRVKMLRMIPALAVLSLVVVGCSEPTGTIAGKVTYKGAAVTNGSIAFQMPSKGIAQNGKLDAGGTFTMATPMPVGTYKVFYVPPAVEPQDPTKKSAAPPEVKTIVPTKFHDLQGSNLSVEVKSGRNDIPIDFKD